MKYVPTFAWNVFVSRGLLLLLLNLFGCDESLPPRDTPKDFLSSTMVVRSGVRNVYMDRGRLHLTPLDIDVYVKSLYDEVLQDSGKAVVSLTLSYVDNSQQKSLTLKTGSIISPPTLRGILTLLPDSTARMLVQWNNRLPDGRGAWQLVSGSYQVDELGITYWRSDSVPLVVKGTVSLFKNGPPLTVGPVSFLMFYNVYPLSVVDNSHASFIIK